MYYMVGHECCLRLGYPCSRLLLMGSRYEVKKDADFPSCQRMLHFLEPYDHASFNCPLLTSVVSLGPRFAKNMCGACSFECDRNLWFHALLINLFVR